MIDCNPAVRAGCCRIDSTFCRALLAGLVALACLLPTVASAAKRQYVIQEPIHKMLEVVEDSSSLCRRLGPAIDHLVLFMPVPARTVPVYWHPSADRFIQYPGTTACVIWKRRDAAPAGS